MKLGEIKELGSRDSFNETWLSEMPSGLGSFETFDALEYTIKGLLKHGLTPKELADGLKRIISDDLYFYWYEADGEIALAVELERKPQGLVVSVVGKNPKLRGKAPYASELYSAILKDTDKSVRIVSDTQLSDEGLALWKKMLTLGHKITVYDQDEPGKTFRSFDTPDELDAFFKHDDDDFKRYQYVLSESTQKLGELRARFNLRKYREGVPGMSLSDYRPRSNNEKI